MTKVDNKFDIIELILIDSFKHVLSPLIFERYAASYHAF